MPTPVPSQPRTFSLTDATCFSGIRKPEGDCQRGGGTLDLTGPINRDPFAITGPFAEGELAAMVVPPGAPPLKKGQVRRGLDLNVTRAEREAVAEWVWRTERARPNDDAVDATA